MMMAGTRERFAIEAEIHECVGTFVLGHIRFWLCGRAVGNWADFADLASCVRWLKKFRDVPLNRYEPGLWDLSPAEVFRLVYDPVMRGGAVQPAQVVHDPYPRFHISHLAMSSFDRFDVLLVSDEHGAERCLWREAGNEEQIHDCFLGRLEMESVAGEFVDLFEKALVETG